MNIDTAFPSKYLKASDLNGRTVTVTIARVEMEKVGDDRKPIIYFEGKSKGLVCNKTNANMIAKIANSRDTDEWTGVSITLIDAEVEFQGEPTRAIRVRPATKAATRPAPPPPVETPADDEIPF
jgi:hypothetical protein